MNIFSRLVLIFAILTLTAFAAGCGAKSGNEALSQTSEASVRSQLIRGKTTQAQVLALYGEPNSRSTGIDTGPAKYRTGPTWYYAFGETRTDMRTYIPKAGFLFQDHKHTNKSLIITFDTKNIVKDYTYTSGQTGGATVTGPID
jgi:outer membrane protein assembly factor BamE (lipoprotein component of BamABCDE complex)